MCFSQSNRPISLMVKSDYGEGGFSGGAIHKIENTTFPTNIIKLI